MTTRRLGRGSILGRGPSGVTRTRVVRPEECYDPPRAVRREVLSVPPDETESRPSGARPDRTDRSGRTDSSGRSSGSDRPPVLMVPGSRDGASGYAEHWLRQAASRGFPAHAMSPRGHGASARGKKPDLRAYVHDVVQVAAALPRQAVLVGHGVGATIVALAMARYPVRAGVLVAPVFPGFGPVLTYRTRGGRVPSGLLWPLLRGVEVERPVGDPPVLVLGTPDDRLVPKPALERVARQYGGAPLLFPGMRHDLMLDVRWPEPIDAICDWLDQLS